MISAAASSEYFIFIMFSIVTIINYIYMRERIYFQQKTTNEVITRILHYN